MSNTLPEWLDKDTIDNAVSEWKSHKNTDDRGRVNSVKIIISKAKESGYSISITKAMYILNTYCL